MPDSLASWAIKYYWLGWSVIPAHNVTEQGKCSCGRAKCSSVGKHPRIRWEMYQRKRASENEITNWWRQWPTANIAIITGKISGIVVLDIDPRHGGDESLIDLKLPESTVTSKTGGQGQHLVFRCPSEPIANRANAWPGIDVRGDGGYIIAPPSNHEQGQRYEWEISYSPTEYALATLPPAILEHLLGSNRAVLAPEPSFDIEAILAHGIPEGQRNVTMTRIAGYLLATLPNPLLAAERAVLINRQHCKPPLDETEIWTIIKSLNRREERNKSLYDILQNSEHELTNLSIDDRSVIQAEAWRRLGLNDRYEVARTICYKQGEEVFYKLVLCDGQTVPLGNDLLSQAQVNRNIANHLHVALAIYKLAEYRKLLLPILETIEDEITSPGPGGQAEDWFWSYCQEWKPIEYDDSDERYEAISTGYPVCQGDYVWVRPNIFYRYVEMHLGIRIPYPQFLRYLYEFGFKRDYLWTGKGRKGYKHVRAMRLPLKTFTEMERPSNATLEASTTSD